MWALRTFAPSTTARLVAAVPKGFAMTSEDARFVIEFIDSLFPVRLEGFIFDAFVSNADVNNYNLEAISVPTLIIHTRDDQLASHEVSKRAAERIPGARFVSLESGGHLMLGQTKDHPRRTCRFLCREEGSPRGAGGILSTDPFASLGAQRTVCAGSRN